MVPAEVTVAHATEEEDQRTAWQTLSVQTNSNLGNLGNQYWVSKQHFRGSVSDYDNLILIHIKLQLLDNGIAVGVCNENTIICTAD